MGSSSSLLSPFKIHTSRTPQDNAACVALVVSIACFLCAVLASASHIATHFSQSRLQTVQSLLCRDVEQLRLHKEDARAFEVSTGVRPIHPHTGWFRSKKCPQKPL